MQEIEDLLTITERKARDRLSSVTLSIKEKSERVELETWFSK
jgi:DNA-binding TFAR19-related protein (PDSD5 family)